MELAKSLKWRGRTATSLSGGWGAIRFSRKKIDILELDLEGTQENETGTMEAAIAFRTFAGMESTSVILIPFAVPAETSSVRRPDHQ